MRELCEELLRTWCQGLLKLQIQGTGNPQLDGGLLCPACGRFHGRGIEAMYPFLYMAKVTGDNSWKNAAERLFCWSENTISQPDGSYLNDQDSEWRGTTVFTIIQLADCLLYHGDIISPYTKEIWLKRLRAGGEFLYHFDELQENNINYPISNALALHLCGILFDKPQYTEKAKKLAALAKQVLTENNLIFGEGGIHKTRSPRNCQPVDIGYNIEETLPSLTMYAQLSQNEELLCLAAKSLKAHQEFMTMDGGWDNSFGTRNYKWSYWGSRTSDGCSLAYLSLADREPEFADTARKNLALLKACTFEGLLTGGPHYKQAGQPTCIHHSFTHGKVLAGILDRNLTTVPECNKKQPEIKVHNTTICHYPEIDTWRIKLASLTATVTAYDWDYMPGGHVSGGTLSFLEHQLTGPILSAGMGEYFLKEPLNMQKPRAIRHKCLAPRIDYMADDRCYSSIYENKVKMSVSAFDKQVTARGILKDIHHHSTAKSNLHYEISYQFTETNIKFRATFSYGALILPIISQQQESIERSDNKKELIIYKRTSILHIKANKKLELPYGNERIFNLVPGFQALQVEIPSDGGQVEISMLIKPIKVKHSQPAIRN